MGMVDNGDAADPVVEVPLVEGVAELVRACGVSHTESDRKLPSTILNFLPAV